LISIAEDFPNLLLQTYLTARTIFISRTATFSEGFDAIQIVSLAFSLFNNAFTLYSLYLSRFMRSDNPLTQIALTVSGLLYSLLTSFSGFSL
jgi:hypothetical protein